MIYLYNGLLYYNENKQQLPSIIWINICEQIEHKKQNIKGYIYINLPTESLKTVTILLGIYLHQW